MQTVELQDWNDVRTVAAYFGCSKDLVYTLCRANRLRHVRLGRLLRISKSALLGFEQDEQLNLQPQLRFDGER